MMLSKQEIQSIIDSCLTTGADFAELFFEETNSYRLSVVKQDVQSISSSTICGVGIRILLGVDEVYGYTNNLTYNEILKLANNLKITFNNPKLTKSIPLEKQKALNKKIIRPYNEISNKKRTKDLLEINKIIEEYDPKIVQAISSISEWEQKVLICNSLGIYQNDLRNYTRVSMTAVAKENDQMQEAYEAPGRAMGYEIFDHLDFKKIAKEVAKSAVLLLNAKEIIPQVMDVVIHNGFGGVLFHEACGHPLEASSVAKKLSPFANKIGEKVASDLVTAYDDGTIENAWGSTNFDDEGTPTKKNLLIENGVLKSYLVDFKNSRKMETTPTGSSRRQSYKYAPTSRMNSTYIANGSSSYEDIIKNTKHGLFAKKLGGGTVQPATGEFNFVVTEGYMIEDGKLTHAIKGAMLIGQGKDVLHNIDMVGNNLEFGQGMCGSSSGSIPVDVGQPTLRVKNMTVGGSGDNKC